MKNNTQNSKTKASDRELAKMIGDIRPDLFRYALKLTKDQQSADDICQNAIIAVWKNYAQFKARGGATLKNWAMVIVKNAFLTYIKKAKFQKTTSLEEHFEKTAHHHPGMITEPKDIYDDQSNENPDCDIAGKISGMVNQKQLVVFQLYYLGHSYVEIAELTGIKIGTVMSTLSRCREKIKRHLERGETL